jgi:hypothetical protein
LNVLATRASSSALRVLRPIVLSLLALVALGTASVARAQPGLLVGITDNRFLTDPATAVSDAESLGLNAAHVFLTWTPGETAMSPSDISQMDTLLAAGGELRIVVSVYGKATDAPTSASARDEYCSYVGDLLTQFPSVNDVVIWNEPNQDAFWQPQYNPDGTSAAPAAYEALLAQCWDALHAIRPDVNLIMSTSPSGNDNPHAASDLSFAPGTFIEDMGAAYRASGRTLPIFDTVGHSAYGVNSSEAPSQQHLGPYIGEGDLSQLEQALDTAFGGTGQPVPGDCDASARCPSVWYLEDGYQTTPDAAHASLYIGAETDLHPVTDLPNLDDPTAPTQSSQLTEGVELAYCQPGVGAFFNFLLEDEPDLAAWQSGLLWVDGSPKESFDAYRQAISSIRAGTIDCSQVLQNRTSPIPTTSTTGTSSAD